MPPEGATPDASSPDMAHESGRGTAPVASEAGIQPPPKNVPGDVLSDGGSQGDPYLDGAALEAGCTAPTEYFADDDRDGFGLSNTVRRACTRPLGAWATKAGDCDDSSAQVFPGQTEYFPSAYSTFGKDSFDYDCSGTEEPEDTTPGIAPNCAALPVLGCTGSGFAPTGRRESGSNPICGSAELVHCAGLLGCAATSSESPPKRCR